MGDLIARVVFVCLGNICRSPMAEAILRRAVQGRGLPIEVDSAGTGNWHVGEPPDRRAQVTALRHGVDISGLRARQVHEQDFTDFTHVVALDPDNLRDLKALRPAGSSARLMLLLDHVAGREGCGVTDPYFGGDDGFEAVWQDISGGIDGLIASIIADQDNGRSASG